MNHLLNESYDDYVGTKDVPTECPECESDNIEYWDSEIWNTYNGKRTKTYYKCHECGLIFEI